MIYETIITSADAQSNPHIAPFGIREREGLILIAPFRPSASLDNLLNSGTAVVNLVDDVRIFAGALTGRRNWPIHAAEKINGFVLDAALAHKELELVEVKEDLTRPELYFRVVHEANHAPFQGFNRAQAAVIELAVLVSRLHMLPIEKIDSEIAYLAIAIQKTAGEREQQAWGWLMEQVENHRAAMRGENLA
ncbi:MAG TPA: DUF447 domain-containing protein [Methylophilaceae bacterium]|nr:DUF447 domain-containing protein [Methylophilaceae bacterium]